MATLLLGAFCGCFGFGLSPANRGRGFDFLLPGFPLPEVFAPALSAASRVSVLTEGDAGLATPSPLAAKGPATRARLAGGFAGFVSGGAAGDADVATPSTVSE